MNADLVRNAVNKGLIIAIVLIFLVLVGFTLVISKLIGNVISQPGSIINLILFLLIAGLLTGSSAARPAKTVVSSGLAGLVVGIISAVLVAAFAFLVGGYYANGNDAREYLSALSPEVVSNLLLRRSPSDGAISLFLILLFSGLAGGVLGHLWRKAHAGQRLKNGTQRGVRGITHWLRRNPVVRIVFVALIVLAVALLPLRWGSYWNYILGTVGIYALLGLGLNLIVGLSGQLVLGYVAFFGIGAYGFALLTAPQPHNLQWGFWPAALGGVILAALGGILIAFPILRLRGDYLAIVTLGFGEIIRILLRSDLLSAFTAGPRGVRNLAQPTLVGQSFSSDIQFTYLILAAVVLLIFLTRRVQNSHVGRSWEAIREDEIVAQASGIDTYKYKLLALALGAAFAGLGGVLFASRNQFTGPEDHILMVSINVLSLVIVGGMGSIPGVILGAFALKGLPEILRDLENYRLLVFGGLLVAMMILRPEGLWPASRRKMERIEPTPQELQTPSDQPVEAEVRS